MIRGVVNARREAVVGLRLRGPGGIELEIAAIINTGFSSSLILPPEAISALGLLRQPGGRATLDDGSIRSYDIYAAEVDWDAGWRPVLISGIGAECLMGMRLLADHRVCIEAVPRGMVEIEPLS